MAAPTPAPIPAFTIDAAIGTSYNDSASAVALPGTPASDGVLRVANLGPFHLAVQFGTTAAAAKAGLTPSTGLSIPAGQVQYLAIPAGALYLGGVVSGSGGASSIVNLATGN